MKAGIVKRSSLILFVLIAAIAVALALLPNRVGSPVGAQEATPIQPNIVMVPPGSAYRQTNFASDIPGLAALLDPLLVNPWGISASASSPFWLANNGTSTSELYRGDVSGSPVVRNPGMPFITIPGGLPTGTVFNTGGATEFVLPGACASPPCRATFLFASITGNIVGWNPNAPAAGSITGTIAASHPGRVYTGLAINLATGGTRLYAADFANNKIDVYDTNFNLTTVPGGFIDLTIPTAPGNTYAPYNIQSIGDLLYVTYAKIGTGGLPEDGDGKGFVRRFTTDGARDLTFGINGNTTTAHLNVPWGVVVAPASFGIFGGALLIGNFGEGSPSINCFNLSTGASLGSNNWLQTEAGTPLTIDELWALRFGNGGAGGDINTMYFTAGTAEEEHGLFGKINPTTATATSLIQFASDTFAIGEGSGHIDITVTRAGDASGSASVNFNTLDESQPDHGSQKSDYEIALSKLTFAPGETSKTVRILIVNDTFDENNETVNLVLSNVSGAGAGLGSPSTATLTINDNDTGAPVTNVIDDTTFFVRQQYLDFLNREPDPSGLAFWVNNIESCGADVGCREVKRIDTSAAFFLSIEFQKAGPLSILANKAAFGSSAFGSPAPVLYGQFEKDVQQLQKDLVFLSPSFDAQLEANKVAYFNDFIARPEFVSAYPGSLTNAQYVDALLNNAGISPSHFVVNLTNSQEVPPTVPTGRPGSFGTATFNLDASVPVMTFSATINNIDVTGSQTGGTTQDNLAAAHIHAGPSVAPGVNGPVVWGFFGAPFNDTTPDDHVVTPFASGVGGTFSGKWDSPEGNGTTLPAQLANIQAGRAYINFHTVQFGGGEIRGNFPAGLQTFRDSLVNGLNAATETRATVLRKIAESQQFLDLEFNRIFVTMEYFGYLRRDPDTSGFNFWLNKLNSFGDFRNAEMVKAFLASFEYRQRFGP